MKIYALAAALFFSSLSAKELPKEMQEVMHQPKYQHASWGLYARDVETSKTLFELNSDKLFIPGSVSKLFTVEALLHEYGDNYRFKTPVYAVGKLDNGQLIGNLVLVGQGDLTFGGRQDSADTLSFTKLDHVYANNIPGAILTKEDPLKGIKSLAEQIKAKGIKEIKGDVLIDDRLFDKITMRDVMLSPIMINENFIDITITPSEIGQSAKLTWRPVVEGYTVKNEVQTTAAGKEIEIETTSDDKGKTIVVKGSIPSDQKSVVRIFSIHDPAQFARAAFVQELKVQGITISPDENGSALPAQSALQSMEPAAVWTSPPLSEYAKLILKVSHNTGANLIPLLLAVKHGEKTYAKGMLELGNFILNEVKLSKEEFVFQDAAGGDGNRLTSQGTVKLLEYIRKQPKEQFRHFYHALPILGVDGSLEDYKKWPAAGRVYAKTGTGISYNLALGQFFLTGESLAGYIEGKNGHLIEFMVVVNNGSMPKIMDIIPVFEDLNHIANTIYDLSGQEEGDKVEQETSTPEYLYKIVSMEQWQASMNKPDLVLTTADQEFIHLSKESQLPHVAAKFWGGSDHVILKLASKRLKGRLVYETNPGGKNKYYHLYEGSIPLDAVVDVTVIRTK